MRPFFIALAATVCIGTLAGWLAAGGGVGTVRNQETPWSLADRPISGDSERFRLYTALMATNHFGAARVVSDGGADEIDDAAPRIAGAWNIGGEIAVSVHGLDETLIKAGVGDALPGGWVIKDASLDRIVVERNGEIREIIVFPYENPGI